MDATDELVACAHCKKEVVKTNLPMHEAHCQRFLCLCPDCDDQVPKDQLEEHREEQHAPVKCKTCNTKMEKHKLPDHEANECPKRLQICKYCELALPLNSLNEHIVPCGSRTECCPDCKQYVMLKEKLQHTKICTAEDSSVRTKNPTPLSANTLQKHELDDDVACGWSDELAVQPPEDTIDRLSLADLQKKKKQQNEKKGWRDKDQISTCPHCHLALPESTLQWHQDKCRLAKGLIRLGDAIDARLKK